MNTTNGVAAALELGAFAVFACAAKRVSRTCGPNVTFAAPLPVLVLAVSFALLMYTVPFGFWDAVRTAVFVAALTVCAISDWQTGYIFDAVSLPALASLLCIAILDRSILEALVGSVLTAAPLLALFVITRGRGIGLGDAKLALCIGAAQGMRRGSLSLAIAFVLGGMFCVVLLIRGCARRGQEIRFAPFLALGIGTVMVLGL